jgi:hypothetical protein
MYGDVIVTRDATEHGLRCGRRDGLGRHAVPGLPEEGYSVELFDMTGHTVAAPVTAA